MSSQTKATNSLKKTGLKSRLNIVLIEDELSLVDLYVKALQKIGDIKTAHTKVDAIALLDDLMQSDQAPNIVLLDLIIPQSKRDVINFEGRPGFDVLEFIRKTKPLAHMPVFVMTNLDSAEDRERAKDLGALKYIVKSNVVPKDIIQHIEALL